METFKKVFVTILLMGMISFSSNPYLIIILMVLAGIWIGIENVLDGGAVYNTMMLIILFDLFSFRRQGAAVVNHFMPQLEAGMVMGYLAFLALLIIGMIGTWLLKRYYRQQVTI